MMDPPRLNGMVADMKIAIATNYEEYPFVLELKSSVVLSWS
jgi:hypothetical protein